MKKSILILMPSMFIGGAERSLLGLLDNIDYTKYNIDLFLYRHEGEFMSMISDSVNILPEKKEYKTFDVPIKKLVKNGQVRYAIRRVYSKFALKVHCDFTKEQAGVWMSMQYISKYLQSALPEIEGSYDMAISFLGIPDVLLNKVNAKVKLAWNHTDYTVMRPSKNYDRELYSKLDYIVSVSDECTKQFLKVYPEFKEKAITIENILSEKLIKQQAVETINDMNVNLDEIALLSIGRYSEQKNFDNVPYICKRIRENGVNIKWFIIGYGGDEQLIKKKIYEMEMAEYVILLGKKENPYPYIKACDLYVQPSRYEGKCVTVREAQILGKPVVITNYATSKNQLEDGKDGIIVPLDNDRCAEEIVNLLNDKEKMIRLSYECKKRDYTNRKDLEKLYSIIES